MHFGNNEISATTKVPFNEIVINIECTESTLNVRRKMVMVSLLRITIICTMASCKSRIESGANFDSSCRIVEFWVSNIAILEFRCGI